MSGSELESHTDGRASPEEATWRTVSRQLWARWLVVVSAFSWVVARVVALVLFVVGFIPYGLVMRLVRFDPLKRDSEPDDGSFWEESTLENSDLEAFRRQY